jgi:alpha-galactosidase
MLPPALPCAPAEFLVLHSRHASLVLEHHADEAPIWRYWGPRLPDGATPGVPLRDGRPLPSFMLDFDQPLTAAPTFGVGWFGQSALLAHRSGQQFAQAFSACTVEWVAPGSALVLHLADPVAQITLRLAISLDPASDVLTLQSTLTNTGTDVLDVQWLAAGTLPVAASPASTCTSSWP